LALGVAEGDHVRLRRAARALADAVLDGARDRGTGPLVRSLIDQQRRSEPLRRTRPRRPGRTAQALAAKRRNNKASM
jgi:hypothetical protein